MENINKISETNEQMLRCKIENMIYLSREILKLEDILLSNFDNMWYTICLLEDFNIIHQWMEECKQLYKKIPIKRQQDKVLLIEIKNKFHTLEGYLSQVKNYNQHNKIALVQEQNLSCIKEILNFINESI